jgi:hypothetical protein
MSIRIALFFLIGLFPVSSFGQGCLTVFSEDGDKFYLVLNGVKQNPTPQTNVRIDGLTNEYYSTRILFADPSKPEISKNIPVKDGTTGQFAEMTYKIKRAKDGALKLRYYSATPVPEYYNAPPDMYVMHYGALPPSEVVTKTTVTTTTNQDNRNGNISISIGGGGVNMNVIDPDQNGGAGITQTTTTTTRSYTQTTVTDNGYNDPPPPHRERCRYAMDRSSFLSAKETVSKASFEDTKLSTAKAILSSNCVSTDQVTQICNLFGFEATKLEFAKFAYQKTTDRGNYFKVGNVFSFDASKTELNNYIGGQDQ